MAALWAKLGFSSEPVVWERLVIALLTVGVLFGAPVNDDQKAAIIVAILAAGAVFTRSQVTPT